MEYFVGNKAGEGVFSASQNADFSPVDFWSFRMLANKS